MLHVDLHHLENIFVFFGVERRREKLDLLLLKDTTFTLYSLLVNKFLSLIIIFYSLPVCLVKKRGRVRIASLFDAFSCHSSSFNFSVSFTLVHVTFTSLKAAMVCQWCSKGFFKTFQNKDMLLRGTCWKCWNYDRKWCFMLHYWTTPHCYLWTSLTIHRLLSSLIVFYFL